MQFHGAFFFNNALQVILSSWKWEKKVTLSTFPFWSPIDCSNSNAADVALIAYVNSVFYKVLLTYCLHKKTSFVIISITLMGKGAKAASPVGLLLFVHLKIYVAFSSHKCVSLQMFVKPLNHWNSLLLSVCDFCLRLFGCCWGFSLFWVFF